MKSRYLIFLTITICISCTNRDTEESTGNETVNNSGFHFIPMHGTTNYPIGLTQFNDRYQLFYTTGSNEWGIATSTNLIDWQPAISFSIGTKKGGDVVMDENNTSGKGQVWVAFYDANEIRAQYSSDAANWQTMELTLPEDIEGLPKVTWYEPTEKWVMLVTNEQTTTVLSSSNLKEWRVESTLELEGDVNAVELFAINNQWGLLFNGNPLMYQLGDFDGTLFTPTSQKLSYELGASVTRGLITPLNDRLIFIGAMQTGGFSNARELSLIANYEGPQISAFPVQEFKSKITAKRRGKLSVLKGDKSTWFSFPIDSIDAQLEVIITNPEAESVIITWDKIKGTIEYQLTATQAESSAQVENAVNFESESLTVDLFIDYNSVEVFLNNGAIQLSVPVTPKQIFNQVNVEVDGKVVDPRAVVYSIGDSN